MGNKTDTLQIRMDKAMRAACGRAAEKQQYSNASEWARRECIVAKLQELGFWPPTPGAEEPRRQRDRVDWDVEYSAEVTE